MLLWMLSVAFSACPEHPDAVVRESTGAVEIAFVEVNDDAFAEAASSLRAALPCATEPFDPDTVLWVHRAWALMRFVDGDRSASQRSFVAIRRLDPSWQPPNTLIPPGHPLTPLWDGARPMGGTVPVELAPAGGWLVDGVASGVVPSDSAFVLQGLDGRGDVVLSGYYTSVSEIPLTSMQALAAPPRSSERRRRAHVIGSVGSAVALVAGSVFLGSAAYSAAHLHEAEVGDVVHIESRIATHTGLAVAFLGAGAVGGVITWAVPW